MVRAACQNKACLKILAELIGEPFNTSAERKQRIKEYKILIELIQMNVDTNTLQGIAQEMKFPIDKKKVKR